MDGQVETSQADSAAVEAETIKGKSPLRRFLHYVARDLAVVCAGLCFLHFYVNCEWSGLIAAAQFLLVLIILVMSVIARWRIGLVVCLLLSLAIPAFCH